MLDGVHYLELIGPSKPLKREVKLEGVLVHCYKAIESGEGTAGRREPAPGTPSRQTGRRSEPDAALVSPACPMAEVAPSSGAFIIVLAAASTALVDTAVFGVFDMPFVPNI